MSLKYTTLGYSSSVDGAKSGYSRIPEKYKPTQQQHNENKFQYSSYLKTLTAYERHKLFINNYFLNNPNNFSLLKRDESRDKRDIDVLKENHQFLWEKDDLLNSWGKELARKYYDKLFKEYCICDLSRYKTNQIGMRWRTEKEVKDGKGQFLCGEKYCTTAEGVRSWEMNFGYIEHGQKKNALIKLRLCNPCSYKLNYSHKRKEIKKAKRKNCKDKSVNISREKDKNVNISHNNDGDVKSTQETSEADSSQTEENIWKGPAPVTSTDDQDLEFDEYLEDLFL